VLKELKGGLKKTRTRTSKVKGKRSREKKGPRGVTPHVSYPAQLQGLEKHGKKGGKKNDKRIGQKGPKGKKPTAKKKDIDWWEKKGRTWMGLKTERDNTKNRVHQQKNQMNHRKR